MQVKPEQLRRFSSFQTLDEHQLLQLAGVMTPTSYRRKQKLFDIGQDDDCEYFLLEGQLLLTAADQRTKLLSADDPAANQQVARLRPRRFSAVAHTDTVVLVVARAALEGFLSEQGQQHQSSDFILQQIDDDTEENTETEAEERLSEFLSALTRNQFVLPSLPEVALQVRALLEQDDASAETLGKAVNSDPAIAAKLVRAANSPLYQGVKVIDTTQQAIVRLGLVNTQQLVMSFALKDVFRAESPYLQNVMRENWLHSVEVAAISYIISKRSPAIKVMAEEALLAGLLHNIGVTAVVGFLEATRRTDKEVIDSWLHTIGHAVGCEVLKHWRFPEHFMAVAQQATQLQRDPNAPADLVDVVQVAKLHAYLCNHQQLPVERIDKVVAFQKLDLGEITPELTIAILDQAKTDIEAAKRIIIG